MTSTTVGRLSLVAAILCLAIVLAGTGVGAQAAGDVGPSPMFDDVTAEGSGEIGGHSVTITYEPEGCIGLPGAAPYGRFAVQIPICVDNGNGRSCVVIEPICADYGDTVDWYGVAVVFGTPGDDLIDRSRIPSASHALIFGFGGDDVIRLQNGTVENYILAGAGDDIVRAPFRDGTYGATIFGGADGDPSLTGTSGYDVIVGGGGNDVLSGGDGRDEMYGGDGSDRLSSCPDDLAHDWLTGGPGVDTFEVELLGGHAYDIVTDYEPGESAVGCDQVPPPECFLDAQGVGDCDAGLGAIVKCGQCVELWGCKCVGEDCELLVPNATCEDIW